MNLLFDQNVSFRITKRLQTSFPNCKHLSDCGLMNCDDLDIWSYAKKYNYAIVTFDADFYDISLINGHPPKIIWLRLGNLTTQEIADLMLQKKDIIEQFLESDYYKDTSCLEIH